MLYALLIHVTFFCSSPKVQTLAKALAPAILRVGGNGADFMTFNRSANVSNTVDEADWSDYSNTDEIDWYDYDLDYGTAFDELGHRQTNFTMTGINKV